MASMIDVARRAGVSPATVSRVLSSAPYTVSEDARKRVLAAVRELDFVPNALARGLLKSRVPVVGVIVHDITDPYFSDVVRGVEDAASAADHLVITCSSDRVAEREHSYVRLLRSMRAAAVIFAGSGLDDASLNDAVERHTAAIQAYGGAVVHLSPHAAGAPEVGVDNRAGIAELVAALVALGHRRIALLAGPPQLYVARERLEGYRLGLEGAGIEFDPGLALPGAFTSEGGASAIDALLSGGSKFTAVMSANDLMAVGALQRLAELRISVPHEVSVAGFDDVQLAGRVAPGLSTVRLPLHELGRRGFEYAAQVMASGSPERVVLPTEVVLRESTGPAPARALPGRHRAPQARSLSA